MEHHDLDAIKNAIVEAERELLVEVLEACNQVALGNIVYDQEVIDHGNINDVDVLLHQTFDEDPAPERAPTFYFEINGQYTFPQDVALQGRSPYLAKILKGPPSTTVTKYWCHLFWNSLDIVERQFAAQVSVIISNNICNRSLTSKRKRRCLAVA